MFIVSPQVFLRRGVLKPGLAAEASHHGVLEASRLHAQYCGPTYPHMRGTAMAFWYRRSGRSTISVHDTDLPYRPRRRPESCAAIGTSIFLGILAVVLACVL